MTRLTRRYGIFLPSLDHGGAERVMLNVAHGLANEPNTTVDLVLVSKSGAYLEQVQDTVNIVDLAGGRIATSPWPLYQYLRSSRPDAVVSALDPANLVLSVVSRLPGTSSRSVVTEHCDFSSALANAKTSTRLTTRVLSAVLPRLIRGIYPLADDIVAVSQGVADDLADVTGLKRPTISVIGNPVITPEVRRKAAERPTHPWFSDGGAPIVLGVGRLSYQKNFALLIDAVAKARSQRPVRLMILGEGEDRDALVQRADEAGLGDDFALPGFDPNPYAAMANAAVFALSSRFEGLPTVLIEALYCGTSVVSTNCPAGPEEILRGGEFGRLVPVDEPDPLAHAILEALHEDPSVEDAWAPYTEDRVVDAYRQTLEGTTSS